MDKMTQHWRFLVAFALLGVCLGYASIPQTYAAPPLSADQKYQKMCIEAQRVVDAFMPVLQKPFRDSFELNKKGLSPIVDKYLDDMGASFGKESAAFKTADDLVHAMYLWAMEIYAWKHFTLQKDQPVAQKRLDRANWAYRDGVFTICPGLKLPDPNSLVLPGALGFSHVPSQEAESKSKALIDAIKGRRTDDVKRLLRDDALKAHPCEPVTVAASMGDVSMLNTLIESGAQVNPTDEPSWKIHMELPLIAAAARGHLQTVSFLLSKGAQVDEHTTGQLAARWYYLTIVMKLGHSMVGTIPSAFEMRYDIARGDPKIVQLILEKGGNIDGRFEDGPTLLMSASEAGFSDVVELLLKKGACVDTQDEYGTTALMRAVEKNREKVVRILLGKGANPNIKNSDGSASLDLSDDPTIEKLLRNAGARE